jgi:hypothetical protein
LYELELARADLRELMGIHGKWKKENWPYQEAQEWGWRKLFQAVFLLIFRDRPF